MAAMAPAVPLCSIPAPMLSRSLLLLGFALLPFKGRTEPLPSAQQDASVVAPPCEDNETMQLRRSYERAEIDNALHKAQLEKALIGLRNTVECLALSREQQKITSEMQRNADTKAHKEAMATLERKRELLSAQRALLNEEFGAASNALQHQIELLKYKNDQVQLEIALAEATKKRAAYVDTLPVYLKQPLSKDGVLTISDRCIPLNGPITASVAQHVSDQIQYYNNCSTEFPIFLMVDSRGGCIQSGLHILDAMHGSQAPVHVVVQRQAGSMAAILAALAVKSYAYPNARFMHHQMAYLQVGKIREHEERIELIRELEGRLYKRLAKKMGISIKTLNKKYYEKSVSGDWYEFAHEACKFKWVDHVVATIRETGIRQKPLPHDDAPAYSHYYSSSHTAQEATELHRKSFDKDLSRAPKTPLHLRSEVCELRK